MLSTVRWLKSCFDSVTVSDIYEMNAINGTDAPYLNAVAMASTDMTPDEVISLLKRWELHCGRTPASKSTGIIPDGSRSDHLERNHIAAKRIQARIFLTRL